jgi:hypothetical protein
MPRMEWTLQAVFGQGLRAGTAPGYSPYGPAVEAAGP